MPNDEAIGKLAASGSISFKSLLSPDSALEAPLVRHAEILDEFLSGTTLALKLTFLTLSKPALVIGDVSRPSDAY